MVRSLQRRSTFSERFRQRRGTTASQSVGGETFVGVLFLGFVALMVISIIR